jgi:LPXTG-motif cell wall-anchored protein
MRKLVASIAGAVALFAGIGAISNGATAAANPQIMLLHGIPGPTVDVAVDGKVVIPNFKPGSMQDLTSFAGQTLKNVEVRAAGTTTVVIGPLAELAIPATGNVTVVAHLDATGKPALSPFVNDISATKAGNGRLTVRHAAAAPAVDIVLGTARPFVNLVNGKEGKAELAAGKINGAKVAPTGADPIADVPAVELKAGSNLIVYAVGSLADNTFTFYTQELTGLGGAPASVPTGDAPVDNNTTMLALFGAAVLAASSGLLLRRRTATVK